MVVGVGFLPLFLFPWAFEQILLPKIVLAEAFTGLALVYVAFRFRHLPDDFLPNLVLTCQLSVFAIATLVSETPLLSISGTYGRWDGLLTLATFTSLTLLALWTTQGEPGLYRWSFAIAWSAYIASVIAIVGSFTIQFPIANSAFDVAGFPRSVGTLGNPSALAQFLVLSLPLSLALSRRTDPAPSQWLGAVRTATLLVALLMTFSRLAWAAALVGLGVAAWRGRSNLAWRHTVGIVMMTGIAFSILLITSPGLQEAFLMRLRSFTQVDGLMTLRIGIWGDALRMAGDRPLLGYGPDAFGFVFPEFESADWVPGGLIDRAHSAPLQLMLDTGLLGLGVTVAIIAAGVTRAIRSLALSAAGLTGSLLGYAVSVIADIAYTVPLFLTAVLVGVGLSLRHGRGPGQSIASSRFPPVGRAAIGVLGAILVANSLRLLGADVAFRQTMLRVAEGTQGQAIDTSRWSVTLAPEQPIYHSTFGDLLRELGRLQEAESEYHTAMTLGSADAEMLQRLAETSLELGHRDLAVSAARRAARLTPHDPSLQDFLRVVESR